MVSAPQLWIAGSIGIDDITTPFDTRRGLLGGSVSYACAAASFFTPAGAVGIIGTDFPGAFFERYKKFHVDLSGIEQVEGKTFRWEGEYHENMVSRTTLRTELGVLEKFNPTLPVHFRAAPFIFLGNMQPQIQNALMDQARDTPFTGLDTMNLWIDIAREELFRAIARADLLSLNDEEARMLSGAYHLRDCAEKILGLGPKHLVIKKGEHGALYFNADGSIAIIPAYPVRNLTDPTGAGDMYAGALMGYLASSNQPVTPALVRTALFHASVFASFGVEGFSFDALETLGPDAIRQRYDELVAMAAL